MKNYYPRGIYSSSLFLSLEFLIYVMKNYINSWIIKLDQFSEILYESSDYKVQLILLHEIADDILKSVGIKSIKTKINLNPQQVCLITSKYNKFRSRVIHDIEVSRNKGTLNGGDMYELKERIKYPPKLSIEYQRFLILGDEDYSEFNYLIDNFDTLDDYIYFISNVDLLILGICTYFYKTKDTYYYPKTLNSLNIDVKYHKVINFLLDHRISEIKEYINNDDLVRLSFKSGSERKWFYNIPEEFNNFIEKLI